MFLMLIWAGRRDREEDYVARGQGVAHAAASEYRVPEGGFSEERKALPRLRVCREKPAGGTGRQSGRVAVRGRSRVSGDAPFYDFDSLICRQHPSFDWRVFWPHYFFFIGLS